MPGETNSGREFSIRSVRIGDLFLESSLLHLRALDPWAEEKAARVPFYVFHYAISNIETEYLGKVVAKHSLRQAAPIAGLAAELLPHEARGN
jgi:hypothetical protein